MNHLHLPQTSKRDYYTPLIFLGRYHPPSPASSTSSVKFIEDIPFILSPLRHYFFDYHDDSYSLISQFPTLTNSLPPGNFTLDPEGFDLEDLRTTISGLGSFDEIHVFIPGALYPYSVPVQLFYNIFPPTSTVLEELPPTPELCE